jgi:hypothetical protein
MFQSTTFDRVAASRNSTTFDRWLTSWTTSLALIGFGFLVQAIGEMNCDNSWFITFAERVYDGSVAYVGTSDPNTPAAFLIYLPALIASRLIGLKAEALTVVEIAVLLAGSLSLSHRILKDAGMIGATEAATLRNAVLFVLFVAPATMFAEREHFATICVIPILSVFAARCESKTVAWPLAALAGLMAGVTLAIKPHFALALALPGVALLVRQRSMRSLIAPETLVAICVLAAYLAAIAIFYPAYFIVAMPDILAVYAPARNSLYDIATKPMTISMVILFAANFIALHRLGTEARAKMLTFSAIGFAIAYLIQGKLSYSHALPAIQLAVTAAIIICVARGKNSPRFAERLGLWIVIPTLAVLPVFGFIQVSLLMLEPHPGLVQALHTVAPRHPKIGAIAEWINVGFPAVRQVDGAWVGRQNSLWRGNHVAQIEQTGNPDDSTRAKLEAIAARDRAELAEDLAAGDPDVILVEDESVRRQELATPELAHALDGYRKAGEASGVQMWIRSRAHGS